MNVIWLLSLSLILLSGCKPGEVSLNTEFGMSLTENSDKNQPAIEVPSIPKNITVLVAPAYINSANASSLTFQGTCESVKDIRVKINGNNLTTISCVANSWSTVFDFDNLPDGTMDIEFLDSASNTSLKQMNLQKDTSPPIALMLSAIPNVNNLSSISLSLNYAPLAYAFYSYKIGRADTTNCTSSVGYSAYINVENITPAPLGSATNGQYKLCLIAKDSFGNEQLYTGATTLIWMYDSLPPTISFASSTHSTYINSVSQSAFNYEVNCSEEGRSVAIEARGGAGALSTKSGTCTSGQFTGTFNISTFTDGNIQFYGSQMDVAGNETTLLVSTLLKDTTPPSIFSVNDSQFFSSLTTSPSISWDSVTDSGSGFSNFKIALGSSPGGNDIVNFVEKNASRNHVFSGLTLTHLAKYYGTVKAFDLAGNFTLANGDGWTADVVGPTISSINDGLLSAPFQSPNISWTTADDGITGSGVAGHMVALGTTPGGSDIVSWVSVGNATTHQFFNAAIVVGATYYASVRAIDYVNNTGTVITGDGFVAKYLIASNADSVVGNSGAFAAILKNRKVIVWGDSDYGGNMNTLPATLVSGANGVNKLKSTQDAFAALMNDGSIIAWGSASRGGDLTGVSTELNGTNPVTALESNNYSFAAIRTDGSVIAWGTSANGGDTSAVSSALNGTIPVQRIKSTLSAYAAIRSDGSVITWGASSFGGDSSSVSTQLNGTIDVVDLFATRNDFIALRADGSIVSWGPNLGGATYTSIFPSLDGTNPVLQVATTSQAASAIRADGSVISWGHSSFGGNNSTVASALNGTGVNKAVQIASTQRAFAAIRNNGSVVAWGDLNYGGDLTGVSEATSVVKTVSITGNSQGFAAILENGLIYAWGHVNSGGAIPTTVSTDIVNSGSPVSKIVATLTSFATLQANGTVLAWGPTATGGDTSGVTSQLNGTNPIDKVYSNPSAFTAVRLDGTFVTWGNSSTGGVSTTVNP